MEIRRIQKTGGSSFTLTLPKQWVESQQLKEQDQVIIAVRPTGSLTVGSIANSQRQMKKLLAIGSLHANEVKRELIALYILGYEEVELTTKTITKEDRVQIRKTLEMLLGFEIVEESSKYITIRNILSLDKISFEQTIEKMFIMTQSMVEEAVTAFVEKNTDLAHDIIERDFEIDKLYLMALRQSHSLLQEITFEEQIGYSFEQAHYYEMIAIQLERIADHAVKIAQTNLTKTRQLSANFNQLLQQTANKIIRALEATARCAQTIDKAKAHRVLDSLDRIGKDTDKLYQATASSGYAEAIIVNDSLVRIQGYLENIAEITIDQALARHD